MNNAINLLPCPMCNCSNIAVKNEQPTDNSGGYFIECPDCGISTNLCYACGDDPIPLLAELWNHRVSTQCLHQIAEPAAQGLGAPTQAARSVLAERARQIAAEGWTPEADDSYNPGVLALHGGLYACHAYDNLTKNRAPEGWQWDEKWWKSKDPRSNLVKAGALILAEIERIDRSYAAQAKQGGA